jgi:hypothetical protein
LNDGGVLLRAGEAGGAGWLRGEVQFGEELAVGTVLWLAFAHPVAALIVLGLLVLLMLWLIPKVWRFIRTLIRKVTGTSAGAAGTTGRGADV